jgi:hypothetical protein
MIIQVRLCIQSPRASRSDAGVHGMTATHGTSSSAVQNGPTCALWGLHPSVLRAILFSAGPPYFSRPSEYAAETLDRPWPAEELSSGGLRTLCRRLTGCSSPPSGKTSSTARGMSRATALHQPCRPCSTVAACRSRRSMLQRLQRADSCKGTPRRSKERGAHCRRWRGCCRCSQARARRRRPMRGPPQQLQLEAALLLRLREGRGGRTLLLAAPAAQRQRSSLSTTRTWPR